MVTRCVAPSASAAMARARSPHTSVTAASKRARPSPSQRGPAGLAVGQQQQRVVGAGVPLDADAVERLVGRPRGPAAPGRPAATAASREDERQHRRHVRPDHGRALGDAGQPHLARRRASTVARDHLDARVGGEDGVGRVVEAVGVASQRAGGARGCRPRCGIGRCRPMTPVEQTSNCSGRQPTRLGGDGGHAAGVVQAALARCRRWRCPSRRRRRARRPPAGVPGRRAPGRPGRGSA